MPEVDLDFHDPRLSMNFWWPRVEKLDIPSPTTTLVDLDEIMVGDGMQVDLDPLVSALEELDADEYFIRGDRKSARVLSEGAFLNATNEEAVRFTFTNLLDSLLMGSLPASSVAVRERINLDGWVESYGKPVAPEVRVFVDEGEVCCHHLRVTEEDIGRGEDADTILREMNELMEEEYEEKIHPYATRVAEEFSDSSWSVDFLRSEDGTWYQTDMALYGLYYYDMEDRESKWASLSAHESGCEYNLEENPPENLPDTPENARTSRRISLE